LYQKLSKSDNCFQVSVENVGDVFLRQSVYLYYTYKSGYCRKKTKVKTKYNI